MPNPSLKPMIGTATSCTQRSWRARLSFICYAESIKKWEQRSGQQAALGVDAIALSESIRNCGLGTRIKETLMASLER